MIKILKSILLVFIIFALNSCMNNTKKDWKLVWSNEFEGSAINENNWNFQEEPAGRFNEEWQRYTNSSENAFIENNCLVIKVIHESDEHGLNQYTSAR